MERNLATLLVIGVLLLMLVAPFSALAMLMLLMFAAGVIWFVSTIVQIVIGSSPPQSEASERDR